MKKQQLHATFKGGEVRVALFVYIDEGVQVCYAPELDLYGYGNTEDEALNSFTIALDEYLSYVLSHKTLGKDLKRLGWTVDVRKKVYTAPSLPDLLGRNDDFLQTITTRSYRKLDRLVALPA